MSKAEFVNEHTRLVQVLQGRQMSKLRSEAREQSEELSKVQRSKTHVKGYKGHK
jgi:hypothetical protein